MIEAATVLLILCVLLTLALFLRVDLHLSVQGRGEPTGAWALAGGASVGPLSLAGVGARGVKPTAHVHVFGRRILSRPLTPEKKKPDEEDSTPLMERYRKLERWLDPVELGWFLVDERRRFHLPELEVDVEYSFDNIMVTSQLMGALLLLESVVPEPLVLRQSPSWEFEDRAALEGSAIIAFRPGLLLWDVTVFLFRNLRLRRPAPMAQAAGS